MDQGDQHRKATAKGSRTPVLIIALILAPLLGCVCMCGTLRSTGDISRYTQRLAESTVEKTTPEVPREQKPVIPTFDYDTPILERLEHVKTGMSEETMLEIMPVPLNKCREPYDEHSSEPSTITYTWDQGEECDLVRVDLVRGEVTFKTGKNRCGQEHLANREQNMKLYGTKHLCTFADVEPVPEKKSDTYTLPSDENITHQLQRGMSLATAKALLGDPDGFCISVMSPGHTMYVWDHNSRCSLVRVSVQGGRVMSWDAGLTCGTRGVELRQIQLETHLRGTCEDKP